MGETAVASITPKGKRRKEKGETGKERSAIEIIRGKETQEREATDEVDEEETEVAGLPHRPRGGPDQHQPQDNPIAPDILHTSHQKGKTHLQDI